MKGLVIHQPYAQLVAVGAKTIETRGYPAPSTAVKRRIAICAGKTTDSLDEFLGNHLLAGALDRVVDDRDGFVRTCRAQLGFVVAVATLTVSEPMTREFLDRWSETTAPGARERAFGWFGYGRWAWHLADVNALDTPVPVRGMQRVFTLPADVAAAVEAQESTR